MDLAEGISIHQYIDGWLMRPSQNSNAKRTPTDSFILSKAWVGSLISKNQDLILTQEIEFLTYKFDLRVGLVFPTQKRIDCLLEKTVTMLKASHISPRKLMSIIGSMASMEKTIPLGCIHT